MLEQDGINAATRRVIAVMIVCLDTVGGQPHDRIERHVGGATVETDDLIQPPGGGQERDVDDAPEVKQGAIDRVACRGARPA